MTTDADAPRVDPAVLEAVAASLLDGVGAPAETATAVAESLVASDLRGHASHGVLRLPLYAEMAADGALDPAATPELVRDTEAVAQFDGRLAFGHLVGRRAAERLAETAPRHGVAAVGFRDGTHVGRVGEWAERVASAGLLFVGFVNSQGGGQVVAPPGTAERRLSTNPITCAVPTFGALPFPVVLDVATSQVAHGKVREREDADARLPGAWTVTESGDPVTDPDAFRAGSGALLPLGGLAAGYKGFGLALLCELLGGIAGDAPVAGQDTGEWFNNAGLFFAVDPAAFTTAAAVREKVSALVDHVRSTPQAEGVPLGPAGAGERMQIPGEPEYRTAERRRTKGIPLPERTRRALVGMADEYGVDGVRAALTDDQ